jgi:membrane protease YdiL (CAAX protease family)
MTKNQLILFTAILLIIGFVCRWSDPSIEDFINPNLGMFIWLMSPFVLMLIFRAINKDWRSFGIKLQFRNSWPWYLISFLLYPVIIGPILAIGKFTETIVFANSFSGLTNAALAAAIPLFIKNIFEEFTWRGYLTPQIDKMGMSRFKNHLIVGVIWALWHLPFLDLMIRSYSPLSFWVAFPLMFIGIIVTAFVYGEICIRSATVWTAVILHAVGNSITNPLFSMKIIKLVPGKEYIASPTIDNMAYIMLMFIVAVVLFRLHPNIKNTKSP